MKSSSEEKARLRTLLSNAISVLCKNSLGLIDLQFSVEALIGISVDNEDVMVVSFKETVLPDGAAVSYIWQKESDESKSEIVEEDAKVNSNALYSAEQFDAQSFLYEQQDAFEEVTNPTDTRIKIEKESMQYEEYSNNFTLSDAYDVNSSSPQVTNQPYSNAANKRRKQSAPIRVCNKQLDSEEADSLESKSCSIQQKLTVNQDYMNSSRFATNSKGSGQFFDSNLNGESRIFTEITKYSVPSKQSAYKSLSASRGLKRGMSRAEVSSYAGTSVGAHSVETPNDLSPNCSLSIAEHDLYSGQAENYTYQVLNTSHSAGANGKRRKPVSSSSAKNISEQDSLIISEVISMKSFTFLRIISQEHELLSKSSDMKKHCNPN